MNTQTLISDILRDDDKCLIAVILFLLWKEKNDSPVMLALLFLLLT